MIAGYCRSRI